MDVMFQRIMRVVSVAFTDDADVAGIETLSQEPRVLRPRSRYYMYIISSIE